MAKVIPVHTIIGASDQPVYLNIVEESDNVTYKFYLDSYTAGSSTPFHTETVNKGTTQVNFTVTGLASSPDNQIHKLYITRDDGSGEKLLTTINIAYLTTKWTLDVKDKDTGENIPGYVYISDPVNAVIMQGYGKTTLGLPDPQYLSDKTIIEVVYNGSDGKYYYISMYSKFTSQIEQGATSVTLELNKLPPKSKVPVTVEYDFGIANYLYEFLIKAHLMPIGGDTYSQIIATILTGGQYWVAMSIPKALGIDLPIISVDYDDQNNKVIVTYEQDPVPLAVILILIAIGVVGAVVVTGYIKDMYVATVKSVQTQTVAKLVSEKAQLTQQAIDQCTQQYGNDPDSLAKCINTTTTAIDHAYNDPLTAITTTLKEDNEDKEDTIDKLKNLVIVAGVIALLIALYSLSKGLLPSLRR
ncbi:hypothetical protein J7M00_06790 [bacterium]|nr:hypothetical protein [bacterium]